MANQRPTDLTFHFARGNPKEHDRDSGLKQALRMGDMDTLTDFFLPHVDNIARFYAAHTEHGAQNFADLQGVGHVAFLEALASYREIYKHPMQSYVKLQVRNKIEAEFDAILLREKALQPLADDRIAPAQEAYVRRREQAEFLAGSLSHLAARPNFVLRERFWAGSTQEEVAEILGVQRQAVDQIERRSLARLRKPWSAERLRNCIDG